MGGGEFFGTSGNIKLYELTNKDLISIKYSKKYENDPPFWYGITPSAMEKFRNAKIGFLAFIMGEDGVLKLPFNILEEYIMQANTSNNADGSIKHYHIFIKEVPRAVLFTNKSKKQWDVDDYFLRYD